MGFPGGSEVKASACIVGDLGSIPGSGRSPGEGNGNPLQYSCLENPMDGRAWWATVHRVTKSRTRLNDLTLSRSKWIHLHDLAKGTTCVPPGFKDTWVCVPIYSYHRCYTSEKAMALHSRTLAWKIPWMEEPGSL